MTVERAGGTWGSPGVGAMPPIAVLPDISPSLGVWSSPRLESDGVTEWPTPKPLFLPGHHNRWLSCATVGLLLGSCACLLLHQASAASGSRTSRPSQLASHQPPAVPLARHGALMENSDVRSSVVHGKRALASTAESPYFDPQSNICLLTIMTQERMASLHRMLAAWDGWISIALLVDSYDDAIALGLDLLTYRGQGPPAPERITLSIVEDFNYRAPLNRFPYNVLRNVALKGCTAECEQAHTDHRAPSSP